MYFLQILQSYAQSAVPQNKAFVHKKWIKRFLHDQHVPQNMKSLQHELMSNLERKSHLLLSDLSRRNSFDTVTNSDYPLSDETFTNRAHHQHSPRDDGGGGGGGGGGKGMRHLNHLSLSHSHDETLSESNSSSIMARDLQSIYVSFFRETLRSRTKALGQYIKTRYQPTHKKYWRDIFLFMSEGKAFLDRDAFQKGIKHCGIKIRTGRKERRQRMTPKERQREIESILNAVFMEMDFDHTGYITVHAFASMMMSEDQGLLTSSNVISENNINTTRSGHNGHHHLNHSMNHVLKGSASNHVMTQNNNTNYLSPKPHHLYHSHSNQIQHRTLNSPRRGYDHLQTSINNQRHHLHHKYGNRLHLHPQHHSYNPQRVRPVPPNSQHSNPSKRKKMTYPMHDHDPNNPYHRKKKKRKRNTFEDGRDDGGGHYVVVNEYDPTPDRDLRKNGFRGTEMPRIHDDNNNIVGRDDTVSMSTEDTQEVLYYHDVEEKTHPRQAPNELNEDAYLRDTWNSINHQNGNQNHNHNNHNNKHSGNHPKHSTNNHQHHQHFIDEEQDEKIPMLDVVQNHMQNMKEQGNLANSKANKKGKKNKHKKSKTKRKTTNKEDPYTFLVTRHPMSRLDIVERKYIVTINREHQCVVLSPSDEFRKEVACEFGLDQIIIGDHESTTIQIKTLSERRIVYEFESSDCKDQFVDLWEATNHEMRQMMESGRSPRPRSTSNNLMPRGIGFADDAMLVSQIEDDVDPNYYEDECSMCKASLCTPSTFYWFFLISTVHILGIYFFIDLMTEGVSDWVLFNMLLLRLSESEALRKRCTLNCIRIFDCATCHYIAYYGVSTQSLITIWTVFWLSWDTVSFGRSLFGGDLNEKLKQDDDYEADDSRPPLEVISFGFVVLSLTFLVFAQFAYCRCRCCSPTVSKTLHTVLARSSYFFMAFYAVITAIASDAVVDVFDIVVFPSFWFSVFLVLDFMFYAISNYVLRRHIVIIHGHDISLRVLSHLQCEVEIPFRVDAFSFLWISNDGASWMMVPVLATTFSPSSKRTKNGKKGCCGGCIFSWCCCLCCCDGDGRRRRSKFGRKMNVERNPYHHPDRHGSSLDFELETMMDDDDDDDAMQKHKKNKKKTRGPSKLKYEAVDSGRTGSAGFAPSHLSPSIVNCHEDECSVMIHSRNKMGTRMIRDASYCFEESKWPLFVRKFECPLTVMCFATGYHRIGIIATDDRVIPAISYLLHRDDEIIKRVVRKDRSHPDDEVEDDIDRERRRRERERDEQYVELLWLANRPAVQYHNLHQVLLALSTTRSIKIVDLSKKKKQKKEKLIEQFLHGVQSQAIFALTSRHQALRIRQQSKHAAVYMQQTEWY